MIPLVDSLEKAILQKQKTDQWLKGGSDSKVQPKIILGSDGIVLYMVTYLYAFTKLIGVQHKLYYMFELYYIFLKYKLKYD